MTATTEQTIRATTLRAMAAQLRQTTLREFEGGNLEALAATIQHLEDAANETEG